jgi:HD-GYP domain-containing protein (c-di-GMP phosphodiesterase class II)/HAMP domain-containing protein
VTRLPALAREPLLLVSAVPDDELLRDAKSAQWLMLGAAMVVMLLCLPLALALARAVAAPLQRLAEEMNAVRRFDFSIPRRRPTVIAEVHDLRTSTDSMKSTIRRFLALTATVAAEDDFDRLLPRLLDETITATGARAGVLYLADDERGDLAPAAARAPGPRDLGVALDALSPGQADDAFSGALAARKPASVTLTAEVPPAAPLRPLFGALATGELGCIAVPLVNRKDILLGLMVLAFDRRADGDLVHFVAELSGTAAVSLETRQLLRAQKALFEALIKIIAGAIDAKSPYTGGHCARVPELARMLAKAACDARDGPYAGFALADEEWEALHVASWLHDCGKVTTPEYVVDKATKLETIYDRIHEVRMRFEVAKRDAEIACWRGIAEGGEASALQARRDAELAALDADFAFVAGCNEGGEAMAPERLERLRRIAERTWQRTLDDRLGISHEEQARRAATPALPLPVTERLLADKPEHRIERPPAQRIADDNPWGFRLRVPALTYDRGELHNLSVGRGTLTDEDRYRINDHIVQTIVMLSALPFPRHLKRVPEIAGGHHEKMDGTGYPKRLPGEALSPLARMMAIADIFEALTAADRPYKKGKTLSEAVRILHRMKIERHVDPDLFDLFLSSGVYLEYARRYMSPELIDAVDVSAYVGRRAA